MAGQTCAQCQQAFSTPHHPKQLFCSVACRSHAQRRPPVDRFWSKVLKTITCWLYVGARTTAGYGSFRLRTRLAVYAHRFVWELLWGPIPPGYEIGHTCDEPACCRADDTGTYEVDGVLYERHGHLWLGTHAANMADMARKHRQGRTGPKPFTICKRGHPLTGRNAIQERSGGQRCRICRNARTLARYHARRAHQRAVAAP